MQYTYCVHCCPQIAHWHFASTASKFFLPFLLYLLQLLKQQIVKRQ